MATIKSSKILISPGNYSITGVFARQILDSRGNPTVEAEVHTSGFSGSAAVPSGASTGIHEALELRDGGKPYLGKAVTKTVKNVNAIIAKKIVGMDVTQQQAIDRTMIALDGTPNKRSLGANAILAVSMACARCAASSLGKPLYSYLGDRSSSLIPTPFMNIINGGRHADTGLQFQEFMIVPKGKNFSESLMIASETYHTLKKIIRDRFGPGSTNIGDEGGFAPALKLVEEPMRLLQQAVKQAGYDGKVKFAIDAAASEFYNEKKNRYLVDGKLLTAEQLMKIYEGFIDRYPVVSMEDVFAQDDWESWSEFTSQYSRKVQIVGDDLLVTNTERIKKAIALKACNALLLKVNQIGSLTEAVDAAKLAMKSNWGVMVSHRSGETEDSFIADLAVGLGCGQIKAGAVCRSDRVAKYNRLLKIEEELGSRAKY